MEWFDSHDRAVFFKAIRNKRFGKREKRDFDKIRRMNTKWHLGKILRT